MQLKTKPQLDALNKQTASTTTVQLKTKPQLDALNKQTASTTTVQLKTKPQLDALKKPAASTTTMQLKKNPQLNPLNKQAQSSEKNIPPKKKIDGGFTLVELTIVFMLITILSAIALPPFLDCSLKARQTEAKQYLSSMNRAQQAKYTDSGAFSTNSITALGIGIQTQTINYKYSISATKNAAFSYAVSSHETKSLTSYVGAVFLVPVSPATNNKMTTVSILCAANSFGKIQLPNPIVQNNVPVCAAGSSELTK